MRFRGVVSELRLAARRLIRNPWINACRLLILATGIGCSASIFGVYHSFLLKAFPFRESERLVVVGQFDPDRPEFSLRPLNYHAFEGVRDMANSIEGAACYLPLMAKVEREGESAQVWSARTSPDYFELLGARAAMGSVYFGSAALEEQVRPALISQAMWRDFFQSSPTVVGDAFLLNGVPHRVAGVLEPDFAAPGMSPSDGPEIYVPTTRSELPQERLTSRLFYTVARLAPGASLEAFQQELVGVHDRVAKQYPRLMLNKPIQAKSLRDYSTGSYEDELGMLAASAALVVMIATINLVVVSLGQVSILARAQAIKRALGIGWGSLVVGMLFENALLSIAGSLAGIWIGGMTTQFVASQLPRLPIVISVNDPQVYGFALLLGFACSAVAAAFSLWYLRRRLADVGESPIRSSNRIMGSKLGRGLALAEATTAAVALIIVGLLVKSAAEKSAVPREFDLGSVYAFSLIPSSDKYPESDDRLKLINRTLEEVKAMPGVSAAAAGALVPSSMQGSYHFVDDFDEYPLEQSEKQMRRGIVSPDYFDTVGLAIVAGRGFEDRDYQPDSPATYVINRAAAELYWPGVNPVGRKLFVNHRSDSVWGEIIGVCENQYTGDDKPTIVPFVYRLASVHAFAATACVIRVEDPGFKLDLQDVQKAVWRADADSAVGWFATGEDFLAYNQWFSRTLTQLLIAFATIIALLTSTGFLAFRFFDYSQRHAEFGLRLALGATRARLRSSLLQRSLGETAIGFGAGAVAAYFIARTMGLYLYETQPFSGVVYIGSLALLCALTTAGAVFPALFFTRQELAEVLKRGG